MMDRTVIKVGIVCFVAPVLLLSACATRIPLTKKMSQAVMSGIKPGPTKTASYEYISHVADGEIRKCYKDSREERAGTTYLHNENKILRTMIREYLGMKFNTLHEGLEPKIKVVLKDFWLEEYSPPQGFGKTVSDLLLGGEKSTYLTANLELMFQITKDGKTENKTVQVSSESAKIDRVRSILDSSPKKNPCPAQTPEQLRVAKVVDDANNKAIIMLNQFLESNDL